MYKQAGKLNNSSGSRPTNINLKTKIILIFSYIAFHNNSVKTNSPSHFWPEYQVSAPVPPHLHSSNMAAACTLVPVPTPRSEKRSFAVASFSVAARNVSVLDRLHCHNRWWNSCCRNKEMIVGWYHCSCVEDLECEWRLDGIQPALLRKTKR